MSSNVTLIAGLGNPEERYERTLHNAGFWFVDELAHQCREAFRFEKRFEAEMCRIRLQGEEIWLIKPQSYMNLSGGPIRAAQDYFRLETRQMLVAHDEIDLPPGTVRLKQGGGHGGHNGLRDIIRHCGADFMRLRLGIGHPGDKNLVTNYVLKRASADVERAINDEIDDALKALPLLVDTGLNAAMKKLHTRKEE
ncbi:MAG: aminoacyl-tRNA hydrolase [Woeseia sp.]